MKVSPSVLASNPTRLAETVQALDGNMVDYIHLDIMDGHFVPPLTFGEDTVTALAAETNIPLDVHLMVENPEREVPKYFKAKPAYITFHIETTDFPVRLAQLIRSQGIKAGISLNPATPMDRLQGVLPFIDLVLVMTVEPGYGGQSFLQNSFARIRELDKLRESVKAEYGSTFLIEVDGGVTNQNARALSEAGVDVVVAGSYVFKADDYNSQVKTLKEACK